MIVTHIPLNQKKFFGDDFFESRWKGWTEWYGILRLYGFSNSPQWYFMKFWESTTKKASDGGWVTTFWGASQRRIYANSASRTTGCYMLDGNIQEIHLMIPTSVYNLISSSVTLKLDLSLFEVPYDRYSGNGEL